jgi:hypothetical protein
MTAFSYVCLQLGSATTAAAATANNSSYTQNLTAKSVEELAALKTGWAPMSIDKLDILVMDGLIGKSFHSPVFRFATRPYILLVGRVIISIGMQRS